MSWQQEQTTIHVDGSCRNNGRSGSQAGAGVSFGPGHPDNQSFPVSGLQTSSRGELTGVKEGLQAANERGDVHVKLQTDSKYAIGGMEEGGWMDNWKDNGWRTAKGGPVKNQDLWQQVDQAASEVRARGTLEVEHVPRNSTPGMTDADRLARQGADYYGGSQR